MECVRVDVRGPRRAWAAKRKSAGPAGAFIGCGLSDMSTKETGPAEREDEMPDHKLVR
jgi:hypothetical protein